MTDNIHKTLARIDWAALALQKQAFVESFACARPEHVEPLQAILNLLDALQDAAEQDGYAVVWSGAGSMCETKTKTTGSEIGQCIECTQGSGIRIATRDDGFRAIEKCDTCDKYETDEDACNAAVKQNLLPPGFFIEPDYPCYIWVDFDGHSHRLTTA